MMSKILLSLLALSALPLQAGKFKDVYHLDDIALPDGSPPEVGGLAFGPKGDLYVVLRRSDVFRAKPTDDPGAFEWSLFASGFRNGCGLDVPEAGKIVVSQMAELTSATDSDGDGSADQYRNEADIWGLSGNYHETNTLTPDGKGGYFIALGTAPHNGPTFFHTKGEYSKLGRRGRNFSSVKYCGWILHLDKEGEVTPWASGFRMANGIYTDPDGETWASDNQGDWKAATPFYHIEKGNFYGHPSSLNWDKDWPADKDPLLTYRNALDAYNKRRSKPAVIIPYDTCRSGAEPIMIPRDGSFGETYAGQYLLPDNNSDRMCRIFMEKVKGTFQGMVTRFIQGDGIHTGNNRLAFSPDGKTLYIGQTVRGWGHPSEGLQRITYGDGDVFDLVSMNITPGGFRLNFSEDFGDFDAEKIKVTSATYQPKWTYGSPPQNKKTHGITASKQVDGDSLEIEIDGLEAGGRVYTIRIPDVKSKDEETVYQQKFSYTVHEIPAGK